MPQEIKTPVTAEEILDKYFGHSAYYNAAKYPKKRELIHDDQNCRRCDLNENLIDAMTEYASQQTAELEARIKELEEQVAVLEGKVGGLDANARGANAAMEIYKKRFAETKAKADKLADTVTDYLKGKHSTVSELYGAIQDYKGGEGG